MARLYRTVSHCAATILVGIISAELMARSYTAKPTLWDEAESGQLRGNWRRSGSREGTRPLKPGRTSLGN